MPFNPIPTGGLFIEVLFQLDGEHLWWPAFIKNICTTGSTRRNTVKVYGHIIYKATKIKSADYNEENGKVQFTSDKLLHVLDTNGNVESETSWRYDFTVPIQTDYKLTYYCEDERSPVHSTHMGSTPVHNIHKTTHEPVRNLATQNIDNGRVYNEVTGNTISNSDTVQVEVMTHFQNRVTALETMMRQSNEANIHEVWLNRLEVCKYTLRKKTLDLLQRPFTANRHKKKTPYSNVFQEHTIRIPISCDYQQFKFLLQDILSKYSVDSEVYIYPTALKTTQPNCATGPLHIVFRSLKDLAKYINITSDDDLLQMQFRRGKGKYSSAVSVLGSTINNHEDNTEGIDFFVGSSSSSFGQDSDPSQPACKSTLVYRLDTKAWDSVNNRFEHDFTTFNLRPSISPTDSFCIDSNKYFQMIWTHQPAPYRSTWSADSTFTGNIILGQLTLVLPTAEFYGRHTTSNIRFEL